MTEEQATAMLKQMTAAAKFPTLSDEVQIPLLVNLAKRADVNGLPPSDANWVPTWDLNAAAAEGWRWKASAVSGNFDFETDGQSFDRSQVEANCLTMATQYANRIAGSLPVRSENVLAEDDDEDEED
jgi:hypothetical protein